MNARSLLVIASFGMLAALAGCSDPSTSPDSIANEATQPPPNGVVAGELVVEPATLIALGFEWYVEGDDDRDASVGVRYRRAGDAAWREGMPLLRLFGEQLSRN